MRLSRYFLGVAVAAALASVVVMLAVMMGGDALMFALFRRGLDPALQAELSSESEVVSPALATALSEFYGAPALNVVTVAALLAGLGTAAAMGLAASRRLMRTLEAVATAAGSLARGQTAARSGAAPTGLREVDDFVRDFDAMAEAISRFEGDLRSTNAAIAHELRTPLTVLTGRITGMIDGVFPADRAGLELLLLQSAQLSRIVDDLRIVTLAQIGRIDLSLHDHDLAALVAAALPEGSAAEAAVERAIAPARARVDPQRVRQILSALLENAARYGGGGVRVETGVDDHGLPFLAVADRGPGLPPQQAARAFDRFWRGEASRDRASGGSGLGLAVVRSLADAQGGAARYQDRSGGGALFTVVFAPPDDHLPGPPPHSSNPSRGSS